MPLPNILGSMDEWILERFLLHHVLYVGPLKQVGHFEIGEMMDLLTRYLLGDTPLGTLDAAPLFPRILYETID
jgi:hypothetical protein